jgi:hypothetical protein
MLFYVFYLTTINRIFPVNLAVVLCFLFFVFCLGYSSLLIFVVSLTLYFLFLVQVAHFLFPPYRGATPTGRA